MSAKTDLLGWPIESWADAITAQIMDNMAPTFLCEAAEAEFLDTFRNALTIAFSSSQEAVALVVGSMLIEESWFENWEKMEDDEGDTLEVWNKSNSRWERWGP